MAIPEKVTPEEMSEMLTQLLHGANFGDRTTPFTIYWINKIREKQPALVVLLRRTTKEAESRDCKYEFKNYNRGAVMAYAFWVQENGDRKIPVIVSEKDIVEYMSDRIILENGRDTYNYSKLESLAPELCEVFHKAPPLFLQGMIDVLGPLSISKSRSISTNN